MHWSETLSSVVALWMWAMGVWLCLYTPMQFQTLLSFSNLQAILLLLIVVMYLLFLILCLISDLVNYFYKRGIIDVLDNSHTILTIAARVFFFLGITLTPLAFLNLYFISKQEKCATTNNCLLTFQFLTLGSYTLTFLTYVRECFRAKEKKLSIFPSLQTFFGHVTVIMDQVYLCTQTPNGEFYRDLKDLYIRLGAGMNYDLAKFKRKYRRMMRLCNLTLEERNLLRQWSAKESEPVILSKEILQLPDCSLCKSYIIFSHPWSLLPGCRHKFHSYCIEEWLDKERKCPVCEKNVRRELIKCIGQPRQLTQVDSTDTGIELNRL